MTKLAYQATGVTLVMIALVGAFLPLLPSTPFLLLASACFAKSSPRWNRWLLCSPLFGSVLRDWQTHRCVRPRTKVVALSSIAVVGGGSLLFVSLSGLALAAMIGMLMAVGLFVMRLPATPLPHSHQSVSPSATTIMA